MDKSKLLRTIRLWWVGAVAIGLTIFFFFDLAMYFAKGEDYTLSATLRSVLAVSPNSFYVAFGGFICGVWFSHLFQFGAKVDGD